MSTTYQTNTVSQRITDQFSFLQFRDVYNNVLTECSYAELRKLKLKLDMLDMAHREFTILHASLDGVGNGNSDDPRSFADRWLYNKFACSLSDNEIDEINAALTAINPYVSIHKNCCN